MYCSRQCVLFIKRQGPGVACILTNINSKLLCSCNVSNSYCSQHFKISSKKGTLAYAVKSKETICCTSLYITDFKSSEVVSLVWLRFSVCIIMLHIKRFLINVHCQFISENPISVPNVLLLVVFVHACVLC